MKCIFPLEHVGYHFSFPWKRFFIFSGNQIAVGNENGCVRVWTLSEALTTAVPVQSQDKVMQLIDSAGE